jgi:hypothetical protein
MSFRGKLIGSFHFEPVMEPTNANTPDTQLKMAICIASLIRTTVFSCATINAGFSNDKLAF